MSTGPLNFAAFSTAAQGPLDFGAPAGPLDFGAAAGPLDFGAPAAAEPAAEYAIPAGNMARFTKDLGKLSKKSERLTGRPISFTVVREEVIEHENGTAEKVSHVRLDAEMPKMNGWVFAARIDHANEGGNIVRKVPNLWCEVPEKYRTANSDCDHCKTHRKRRDTYALLNEMTGEFKQVGSTCLTEFFDGVDPNKLARQAELLGYAVEVALGNEKSNGEGQGLADHRLVSVPVYLGHVAAMIRLHGWVSGKQAYLQGGTSTRDRASSNMFGDHGVEPTEEDFALAEQAHDWAAALNETAAPLNEYLHNINVVAQAPYMEARSLGLAASIVGVFKREQERKQERAAMGEMASVSQFVGKVGDKLDEVMTVLEVRPFSNDYGTSYIYRFSDKGGNVLVWFANADQGISRGDRVKVRGTVKKHETFRDLRQTTLTRCSVEDASPQPT